jgi:predicted phage tail protein
MVKVQLHGDLGKEFENSWNLDASSVGEVLRAIECQCPNFQEYVINAELNQAQRYYVAVDDKKLLKDEEFFCKFHKNTKKIDILPMVGGGAPALPFLGKMLLAMAVGAATSMIVNKLFEPPDPQELKDTNSYLFNAAENTESQGIPVPIAYGKLLIGGKVVSAVNQYRDTGSFGPPSKRHIKEPWLQATAQKLGRSRPITMYGYYFADSIDDVLNRPGGKTFNKLFYKQRSVNRNSPKE